MAFVDLVLGVVAAAAASVLYNTALVLQAAEARKVPPDLALRPGLLGHLAHRKRWMAASALAVCGYPLQMVALLLAPLSVVQPTLASGLFVLLVVGKRRLGEAVGRHELLAVLAIFGGVAGVAWAAPARSDALAAPVRLAIGLGAVACVSLATYVLRRARAGAGLLVVVAAGAAYSWSDFAIKLVSDEISQRNIAAVAWFVAGVVGGALALLSEMTALQRRRATQTAPIVFGMQVVVPVVLSIFLTGEAILDTPLDGVALLAFLVVVALGAAALGNSRAVASVVQEGSGGYGRDRARSSESLGGDPGTPAGAHR